VIGLLLLALAPFASRAATADCASDQLAHASSSARPAAPAQEQRPAPPACKKCQSSGRLPCVAHDKALCAREDAVLYCSEIAGCEPCGGSGWLDCGSCEDVEAQGALDRKRALVKERGAALAYIDKDMGRAVRKCETAHFVLAWELDRLKVDKRMLESHELLHLHAERLETLFKDHLRELKIKESDFREKFRVFVWWLPDDHRRASGAFCGQTASGGVKKMGTQPSYSVCGNKQFFQGDEQLHRNLVHNVTHLILSAHVHPEWMGRYKAGWLDEGLAHWFEDKYWGVCDNYCFQEQNTNVDFKGGRFRLAVRQMVEKGEAPAAATVFEQTSDTLTLPQHAVSFSYVDYLLHTDPEKLVQVSLRLKRKIATRDALKEVMDLGVMEFESNWKSFVLATYPKR